MYLCCALTPTREGIEEANASRGHQKQNKNHVVHCGEVHLDYVPHDDAGCWRSGGAVGDFARTASGADYDTKESPLSMDRFPIRQKENKVDLLLCLQFVLRMSQRLLHHILAQYL